MKRKKHCRILCAFLCKGVVSASLAYSSARRGGATAEVASKDIDHNCHYKAMPQHALVQGKQSSGNQILFLMRQVVEHAIVKGLKFPVTRCNRLLSKSTGRHVPNHQHAMAFMSLL